MPKVTDVVTVGMLEASIEQTAEAFGEALCVALKTMGANGLQLQAVGMALNRHAADCQDRQTQVVAVCRTFVTTGFLTQLSR